MEDEAAIPSTIHVFLVWTISRSRYFLALATNAQHHPQAVAALHTVWQPFVTLSLSQQKAVHGLLPYEPLVLLLHGSSLPDYNSAVFFDNITL